MFGLDLISVGVGVLVGQIPAVAVWAKHKISKVETAVAPVAAKVEGQVAAEAEAVVGKVVTKL